MTLTCFYLFLCIESVYLWGADRMLLIGSLLSHPHHHTHKVESRTTRGWGRGGGGSLLRSLSAPSSHQQQEQSQHGTPVSCISHALWLEYKWEEGRERHTHTQINMQRIRSHTPVPTESNTHHKHYQKHNQKPFPCLLAKRDSQRNCRTPSLILAK